MVCSSLAMTGAARPHMWYYYSGDNFGRKEPQLVSFYERDEKEPVVWEHRRGDYVITLWRTVDVGSFYERDEVTSWDKLRVRYQGKTVCKVQGGNWVDTARCCPERAVIKIWRYDDLVYLGLFNGTSIDVEAIHFAALPAPGCAHEFTGEMSHKIRAANLSLKTDLIKRLQNAADRPIERIVSHRDTRLDLDDEHNWYYEVKFRGWSEVVNEELNERDALYFGNKLVRDYQRKLRSQEKEQARKLGG
jgi:hypothetical protein